MGFLGKYIRIIGCILGVGLIGLLVYQNRDQSTVTSDFLYYTAGEDDFTKNDIMIVPSKINELQMISGSSGEFSHYIRQMIIAQLIKKGYTGGRVHRPYGLNGDSKIRLTSGGGYEVDAITGVDMLDRYIKYQVIGNMAGNSMRYNAFTNPITIKESVWRGWSDLYLFKQYSDLQSLGYVVVSYRTRVNRDPTYRRFNIMTAFAQLGNVKILHPGEQLEYLRDINYDEKDRVLYRYGATIVSGKEVNDYGGGICGSSTALYQGMILNSGLLVSEVKSHTKWYSSLYTAFINGQLITTPGIDSALYEGMIDLSIRNIRLYPIIIIANYDGKKGSTEEVFTLGMKSDQGSMEFLGMKGKCYYWLINGVTKKSCYQTVNN